MPAPPLPEVLGLCRQLVGMGLGLVLLAGLLTALALGQQRELALESGQKLNESLAQVVELQAASAVQAVDQRLQITAQGLAMLTASGGATDASVRALLSTQAAALPFVRAIWWLDSRGRVLHAPDASAVGLQLADREFFQAYLRQPETGFYLGSPVRSRTTGLWLISAALPLRSANGDFAGVLVAGLDPPYFDQLWKGLDLGSDGAVALLRRDGVLLMRSPILESAMGQNFSGSALFSQRLAKQPAGRYAGPSPVDSKPRLNAYRSLPGSPALVVLVARSADTVLAPWRQQAMVAVSIWAVAAGVIALLFFALERAWRQRAVGAAQTRQSAERLMLATETGNIGVWEWDVEHDRWHASGTWYTMLGQPPEHAPGDRTQALMSVLADDRGRVATHIQAVLAGTSASCACEARMQHADGSIRWMEVASRVTARDAEGKPLRLMGTRIDITERRQLLQELQTSEARFRALVEQAAVGVAHVTLEGSFALVNQRFAEITGRSREVLQACSFQQITHADDLDIDLAFTRRLLAGDIKTYTMEKRYWRPDQSLVWVNLTVSLVRDHDGAPIHFISVVEDITARKQTERALQDRLTELQRWHTAMMGRELRTVELKREVNALLGAAGMPARYPSVRSPPSSPRS